MVEQWPGITLRTAQETDLDVLVELERLCFFPHRPPEEIREWVFASGVNPAGHHRVVAQEEATQRLIATCTQLDFTVALEEHRLPAKGISSVAVVPDRRGQGMAHLLLRSALQDLQAQQIPLAMLYPFSYRFYRELGWAWVGKWHQYAIATPSLPDYPERRNMVAYQPERHKESLQEAYQRSAIRHNGWLLREPWQWERWWRQHQSHTVYCYVEADKVLGYVVLHYAQLEAQTKLESVVITEWVALSTDAYRGILGFLARLRDQFSTLVWNTYPEDPFPHLLKEPQRDRTLGQHPSLIRAAFRFGEIGAGMMWRLVDVAEAFRLRPVNATQPFILTFQISDPVLGEQTITANFTAERMHPVSQPVPAVLKTSIDHLTELFCGVRRATELVRTREIEYEGDRALLKRLDAAWQCTPPFCWDFF